MANNIHEPKPKTKSISIRVDDDLSDMIERFSEKTGMTIGEMARRAIKEYLWAHPLGGSSIYDKTS